MNRLDQQPQTEIKNYSVIKVIELSRYRFNRAQSEREGSNLVDIDQEEWKEVDSNVDITNIGGSPCAIFYFFDKKRKKTISAHFSEVNEKINKKFLLMERDNLKKIFTGESESDIIEIPEPGWINRLNAKSVTPGFPDFEAMFKYIENKIKEDGENNFEVYLFGHHMSVFGQSYTEAAQMMTKNIIEQRQLTNKLNDIGMSESSIHDHRTPTEPNIDDTFYDSQKRIIYRHRRNKFVLEDNISN